MASDDHAAGLDALIGSTELRLIRISAKYPECMGVGHKAGKDEFCYTRLGSVHITAFEQTA